MKENLNSENKQIISRNFVLFTGAVLLIMYALSTWAWFQLPDGVQLPVHWGFDGQPDRYGGIFEGLYLLPIIVTGVSLLFYVIPKIEPRRMNMALSQKAYVAVWITLLLFMLLLHVTMILSALGNPISITIVIAMGIGVLLIVIGNYLGKIRSNYMFGIRTPWTLASDLSWNKTHRLGGKLFILSGLLTIISGLIFSSEIFFGVMLTSILGSTLLMFVYSYLVWKGDPEMQGG